MKLLEATHSCNFSEVCSCSLTRKTSNLRNYYPPEGYSLAGDHRSSLAMLPPIVHLSVSSLSPGKLIFEDCTTRTLFSLSSSWAWPVKVTRRISEGERRQSGDVSSLCAALILWPGYGGVLSGCHSLHGALFHASCFYWAPGEMLPLSCLSSLSVVLSSHCCQSLGASPSCFFLHSVYNLVNSCFVKISSFEPSGTSSVSFWDPDQYRD